MLKGTAPTKKSVHPKKLQNERGQRYNKICKNIHTEAEDRESKQEQNIIVQQFVGY